MSYNQASQKNYWQQSGDVGNSPLHPPPLNLPEHKQFRDHLAAPSPSSTSPISPQMNASAKYPSAYTSSNVVSQIPVRRHHRKRSSTIFVQARHQPQLAQTLEDPPLAPGLLKGATTLAAAQLLSKLLAFSLNQVLIRFIGSRDLGAASQLDLLVSSSLSLSRDAVRLASQRQSPVARTQLNEYTTDGRLVLGTVVGDFQETVNLGWTATVIGSVILTLSGISLYGYGTWPHNALLLTILASLIELGVEPCFLLMQLRLQFSQRARAESIANIVRVSTVAFCLAVIHTTPFLGFSLGHLSYSLTLAAMYLRPNIASASEAGFRLLPTKIWASQRQISAVFIGERAWHTTWELGVQQVVKYFLTEGDKIAVGIMTTLEEQGEYALAANYGSLLARMVFLPVEDALRGYFTRVFPKISSDNTGPASSDPGSPVSAHSNTSSVSTASDSDESLLEECISDDGVNVLSQILRVYSYLGVLSAGFGPLIAGYLIGFVVRTASFANAAQVLAAYACYIPILAWNGSLDALVQSVAPLKTLRKQGFVLAGLAGCFMLLTYTFVSVMKMGAVGLVWAQIAGMSLRMLWSLNFANSYFGKGPGWIRNCLPPWWVQAVGGFTIVIARFVVGPASCVLQFLAIAALALVFVVAGLFAERRHILDMLDKLRKAKSKKQHID